MTKYVLNSGGIRNQPKLKKDFHQEMVKDLGQDVKILMVLFPVAREYWEQKYPLSCASIQSDLKGYNLKLEMAFPDTFESQVKAADVIYMAGGDDALCRYWFSSYDLPDLFKNKVVATNSATSEMLAVNYWTCDWRKCDDGFGILPIKFLPHYKSEFGTDDPRGPINWEQAKRELEEYGDKRLPLYALKEGEYEVFEV